MHGFIKYSIYVEILQMNFQLPVVKESCGVFSCRQLDSKETYLANVSTDINYNHHSKVFQSVTIIVQPWATCTYCISGWCTYIQSTSWRCMPRTTSQFCMINCKLLLHLWHQTFLHCWRYSVLLLTLNAVQYYVTRLSLFLSSSSATALTVIHMPPGGG